MAKIYVHRLKLEEKTECRKYRRTVPLIVTDRITYVSMNTMHESAIRLNPVILTLHIRCQTFCANLEFSKKILLIFPPFLN